MVPNILPLLSSSRTEETVRCCPLQTLNAGSFQIGGAVARGCTATISDGSTCISLVVMRIVFALGDTGVSFELLKISRHHLLSIVLCPAEL